MRHPHSVCAALALAAAAVSVPAQAASGQIDSFGASTLSVTAGGTVDFFVQYSVSMAGWSGGGSNHVPPEPAPGDQTWDVNWYSYESETLNNVWLQARGWSLTEFPAAVPDSSYNGSQSFSLTFETAGQFDVELYGGWEVTRSWSYSNESASRSCYHDDPDAPAALSCSDWTWSYSDGYDSYTETGTLGPAVLRIQVLAVPEPQTVALWLAGLGLLGVRLRATRR